MQKHYNFNNGYCAVCDQYVAKGTGTWWHGEIRCLDHSHPSIAAGPSKPVAPLFPYINIEVDEAGEDGNAFAILSRCQMQMIRMKFGRHTINRFIDEATEGDYDHLLATVARWFTLTRKVTA